MDETSSVVARQPYARVISFPEQLPPELRSLVSRTRPRACPALQATLCRSRNMTSFPLISLHAVSKLASLSVRPRGRQVAVVFI